ncbi:hypothetical protein [Pseudomonas amygdali]|uniref:hypothetical protein n=1 Tax=Pseudomonas amygdali TaxID=47877 RepID=UPI0012698BD5|nr:hypothetical protein [Pseudomonas amygdali]
MFDLPIRGCTPESPKIPSENIIRVVPGCFCYPIRFFVHIWPLNRAVFGLAVSLPENNCLALIRTRTGFPTMTEISGIPAYNPGLHVEAVSIAGRYRYVSRRSVAIFGSHALATSLFTLVIFLFQTIS